MLYGAHENSAELTRYKFRRMWPCIGQDRKASAHLVGCPVVCTKTISIFWGKADALTARVVPAASSSNQRRSCPCGSLHMLLTLHKPVGQLLWR